MRSNKTVLVGAGPLLLAVGLSACSFSGGAGSSASAADGHGLNISMQFSPRANFALETDDAFVLSQVGCLETLVRYDSQAGKLEPSLATDWKQTSPQQWDFTLRPGVTFQNGTKLTAQVVVDDLTRALKVETPAKAFKPAFISSVTAPDDKTVRISTPSPSPLIPARLSSVNTGILAPEAFKGSGVDPVGTCTGPFKPTSYTPGQTMSLVRNDSYWGTKAALASVTAKFVPDGATRATQVRTGESDIAMGIPAASLTDLTADKSVVVSKTESTRTNALYFNVSKAPFNNKALRQAIQSAIDTSSIASQVYDGTAQPAIGPFSANQPWSPKGDPVKQDLAKAKSLLAASGVDPKKRTFTLLAYTDQPEFADLATVIQSDLAKIGITVKVKSTSYAAIEPDLLSGNYDMSLLSRNYTIDIPDPIGALTADYTCKGTYNISHYCDAQVDQELAGAATMDKAESRYAVYAKVAQKLQDDAVTVYLVHPQTITATRSTVKNFQNDPLARVAITSALALGK